MSEFERFNEIIHRLRGEEGCPWDRAQTHESLKPEAIEESAELIGAINIFKETGDFRNLKEELGDLLLQVFLHCTIAEEEGLFTLDDVLREVSDKMIRRHPHVFGDKKAESESEALSRWEEIKAREKDGISWEAAYLREAFSEANRLIDRARERKGM